MSHYLVTGGTGVLGRVVVDRLVAAGDDVVVLTRRPDAPLPEGVRRAVGDLATGQGLPAAVAGVDRIIHCASAGDYRRPERDIDDTRRLLTAARAAGAPHLVYISIVGVDRIPFGYYRAKLGTERLIEASGLPWTVLRATQFHELVHMMLHLVTRPPVVLLPGSLRDDPVDTADVADRLVELGRGEPAGRVPDLGGPQRLTLAEALGDYVAVTGLRKPVLPLWLPPTRVVKGFQAGGHLLADGVRGTGTFADYLQTRIRPDGTIPPPYDLRAKLGRRPARQSPRK